MAFDTALAASALLMGIAGAPHCAAMCGAACRAAASGGIPAHGTGEGGSSVTLSRSLAALHAGRIAGYAVVGGLLAGGVAGLGSFSGAAPLLRPLWAMVHVGALVLGLWLLGFARAPAWLSAARPWRRRLVGSQPVRVFRRLPATTRSGILGACWVTIPCGLLQSALIVAALASDPLGGAAVMASFGVASTLGLTLGQTLWARLRRADGRGFGTDGQRFATLSVRLAGAVLAGASAFALWHGLGSALCGVTG